MQAHDAGKELELILGAFAVFKEDVALRAGILDGSAENAGLRESAEIPKVTARSARANRVE
jgi:hypothetical protein